MKEHPILFSGPMVRAILEGRKTQTRRVVNPQPREREREGKTWGEKDGYEWNGIWFAKSGFAENISDLSPYGLIGDRLWVRETWASGYNAGCWGTICKADGTFIQGKREHAKGPHYNAEDRPPGMLWRPSIFMPRWASRITLEITNVRVERLQEISFSDIRAEGKSCPEHDFDSGMCVSECASLRNEWATGWDKINGKRKGCAWADNPWVWCISFSRANSEGTSRQ